MPEEPDQPSPGVDAQLQAALRNRYGNSPALEMLLDDRLSHLSLEPYVDWSTFDFAHLDWRRLAAEAGGLGLSSGEVLIVRVACLLAAGPLSQLKMLDPGRRTEVIEAIRRTAGL